MRIIKLQKTIISFKGGVIQFLNGLTSNTMDKPQNAFVNIHGRIIAVFDQVQINEDEFFLCFEKNFVPDMLAHIERYMQLGDVEVKELKGMCVYFDLDGDVPLEKNEHCIEQKKGKLILSTQEKESTVSEEEFTYFRVCNNIPVQGIDFQDEFLLNVSMKEYVSFTKGCFLGQEPISKVYNRSKPSWQLAVRMLSECSEEEAAKMTSKVKDPQGQTLGFVFIKNERE